MFRGYTITAKLIFIILGVIVLIAVAGFAVRSCDVRRSKAAQTRMERSQAQAQSNSAADAIATVAASGEREATSNDLTRSNEGEIRAAPGSSDKVNPAARAAGRSALCRRDAYKNDPKCRGGSR